MVLNNIFKYLLLYSILLLPLLLGQYHTALITKPVKFYLMIREFYFRYVVNQVKQKTKKRKENTDHERIMDHHHTDYGQT